MRLASLVLLASLAACGGGFDAGLEPETESAQLPGSTPAQLRNQLRALAARAQTAGATITARAEPIVALIAETPAQLRALVEPTRRSALALNGLANALELLARRVPTTQTDVLLGWVASTRAQVQALGTQAALLERAAHGFEAVAASLRISLRIAGDMTALAARINEGLITIPDAPDDLTFPLLQRLHVAMTALVAGLDAHKAALPALRIQVGGARALANRAIVRAAIYPGLGITADAIALTATEWTSGVAKLGRIITRTDGLVTRYDTAGADVTISLAGAVDSTVDIAETTDAANHGLKLSLAAVLSILDLVFPVDDSVANASFRILTYNTAFVSATIELPFPAGTHVYDVNDGVFSGLDYVNRAHEIAAAILRGDQDVVVLNEVFSDVVRTILISELQGRYPHYVSKLAGVPKNDIPFVFDEWLAGVAAEVGGAAAEALVDLLFALWPDQTDYLVIPGDSGLMVFSKYPFLPLQPGAPNDANCSETACAFQGHNNGGPVLPDEVAFHIYEECAVDDCFASKGIGVVLVDTPIKPSYVGFTHLQADEGSGEENASIRVTQYAEVRDTIAASADVNTLAHTPVYFVGDLNTQGHNRDEPGITEWFDVYDPISGGESFFSCGNNGPCLFDLGDGALLTDAWGFETSVLDPGLSQLNDHQRLDYINHNDPDGRSCMQHVHIAYDMAANGSVWYSDHLPIRGDFNRGASACSANDAASTIANRPRDVVFPSAACDADPATPAPSCAQDQGFGPPFVGISHGGSFQWFRIEQAGSYSINLLPDVAGENVAFDVYQGADMSRPIAPFSDDVHPRWGTPFAMLHPPYYIRTYAVDADGNPDRIASGRDYHITFHQHLCRDPEDACFLPAASKYPYTWPEVTAFTTVDALYFKWKTSGVKLGHLDPAPSAYPVVKFQEEAVQSSHLACFDSLVLEEYTGVAPPVFVQDHPVVGIEVDPADTDWDDVDGVDRRTIAPDLDGDTVDELKVYYVKMRRHDSPECSSPMPTTLRLETDLTYFRPTRVRCYQQYDDSGVGEDDHVKFHFFFDTPYVDDSSYCDSHACHYETLDEPQGDAWLSDAGLLQGYFVDEVALGMWEDDNGADLVFDTGNDDISALHPYFEHGGSHVNIEDNPNPDNGDYTYKLHYVVCREKAGCQQ